MVHLYKIDVLFYVDALELCHVLYFVANLIIILLFNRLGTMIFIIVMRAMYELHSLYLIYINLQYEKQLILHLRLGILSNLIVRLLLIYREEICMGDIYGLRNLPLCIRFKELIDLLRQFLYHLEVYRVEMLYEMAKTKFNYFMI
jgi:hypothetical protein